MPPRLNSSLVVSPLLLVMGVDEPNKLGRVAELVTIEGAFFNLVLVIVS